MLTGKQPFASRLTFPAASDLLQERKCMESKVPAKRMTIIASFCLISVVNAANATKQQSIQVFIRPDCKDMFYGPDFVDFDAQGKVIKKEKRSRPDYVEWDPARAKPMSFEDAHTSILFYVESDGRHLAAIDREGRLLWVRDPFQDRNFCPYRTPRPVISHLATALSSQHLNAIKNWGGDVSHEIISIQFDSSPYGVIDQITGDFFPEGQN
jgi:hypothetical protein